MQFPVPVSKYDCPGYKSVRIYCLCWVTLIREINLISRNQLSLAKSTYKNSSLNN